MSRTSVTQGDSGTVVLVHLRGDGDLGDVVSVVAHVRRGTTTATLTGSVVDSASRVIGVDSQPVTGWLVDAEPGKWAVEYQITFTDGSVNTWPEGPKDTLIVESQIA